MKTTVVFPERPRQGPGAYLVRSLAAAVLSPACALLAVSRGAPGMKAHAASVRAGVSLLARRRRRFPRSMTLALVSWPLDSTRYPEFDFCGRAIADLPPVSTYLDVSSPRLLPLTVLQAQPTARVTILNPDAADLPLSRLLFEDLGVADRCTFVAALLTPATAPAGAYDLVTCMSVLEHIPEDRAAVETMWRALRPGGRLLLTVPCSASGQEQYTNLNQYGVLQGGADGLVFRQRLYSWPCLEARVFAVTGAPDLVEVWGEREPGFILRDTLRKWSSITYPFWSEPLRAASALARFDRVDQLPGEGVVGLQFVKRA